MKVFYFKKIKGKINPNPLDLSLSVESKLVTKNLNGSYSIKCNNLLENIKISNKSEEEKNNEKSDEVIRWSKNLLEIEKLKKKFATVIMEYLEIEK